MSEQMQDELENLLTRMSQIPEIQEIKREQTVDRIKTNLVDAGDKVNRSNDGLIGQLRKFVEQKNLAESRHVLRSIEEIENLLLQHNETVNSWDNLLEIDGLFKPRFIMERPLFSPPVKISFDNTDIEHGLPEGDTDLLFEQFYVDIEELRNNIRQALRNRTQVALSELLDVYKPQKGLTEILAYMQIATNDKKHCINRDLQEELIVENIENNKKYSLKAPVIVFNK